MRRAVDPRTPYCRLQGHKLEDVGNGNLFCQECGYTVIRNASTIKVRPPDLPTDLPSAPDLCRRAADLMAERGRQYDKEDGERDMRRAVEAFNTITGQDMTEPEGWLFMQVLKDVRQWTRPGHYHADSAEDCIAYAALKAESLARDWR